MRKGVTSGKPEVILFVDAIYIIWYPSFLLYCVPIAPLSEGAGEVKTAARRKEVAGDSVV